MSDPNFSSVPGGLVTIATVASFLDVNERTVRNYISRGLFPAYRIPGTRGVRLKLNEVRQSMRLIPTSVARPPASQFGPKAKIVTLPVGTPVAVEVVPPKVEA
jgi:excisionase family DNA binding protein